MSRPTIEQLLELVRQPNPTDPSRWDIAPGKHKEFSEFVAALRAQADAPACSMTGLPCIPGCTRNPCAGMHIPLNRWPTELQHRREAEAGSGEPVEIGYTNWRGEYAVRRIIPIRPWFGSTEWHPEPQWLLKAIDAEKGAERDFAIADIGRAASPSSPASGVRVKATDAATDEAISDVADITARAKAMNLGMAKYLVADVERVLSALGEHP